MFWDTKQGDENLRQTEITAKGLRCTRDMLGTLVLIIIRPRRTTEPLFEHAWVFHIDSQQIEYLVNLINLLA